MNIIKLSVRPVLADIFLRQTPDSSGIWGNCRFVIDPQLKRCDWWVVCHNSALNETETTLCDPDHIVYISLEPTDSWLPKGFLDQFSRLVLCDRAVRHPRITYRNGLNWWVGMQVGFNNDGAHRFTPRFSLDYEALSSMPCLEKKKSMSVLCSKKAIWSGHEKRLAFIEKLKKHPVSSHIDFFGGGENHVDDKWDAIAPYQYHMVLENSIVPDYWSEKLADSYLGYAYPLYYGCPNIHDYFHRDSLSVIDIENFDATITVIEKLLAKDHYDRHISAVTAARNQVLNDYNLFQLISEICGRPANRHVKCRLKPRDSFPMPNNGLINRLMRRIYREFSSLLYGRVSN